MATATYPLSGPTGAQLRIGSGSLTVHARDGLTEASVTLAPRVAGSDVVQRTVVELRGSTLHVTAPRPGGGILGGRRGGDRDGLDVTVTLPSGSPVKATTRSAKIAVSGRCGAADIASGASEISLEEVDGDLVLRCGSGSCDVARVNGSVKLRAGRGDARFGAISGALSAQRGSGRLEVAAVHGAVRARAGSGATTLGEVHGDVDIASGAGALEIGIPAGQLARLDVMTGSGQVRSEMAVAQTPGASGTPITVRAHTGSGDIRLFRAAKG